MRYAVRRALVLTTIVFVGGGIVPGCSGTSGESGVVGTPGPDGSPAIGVGVTSPFITVEVENRAGQALIEMKVTLKAGALLYTASVPRIEPSEKRVLNLNEFKGTRDGAVMNLNFVTPREIIVTASDVNGKNYEVTAPWKP